MTVRLHASYIFCYKWKCNIHTYKFVNNRFSFRAKRSDKKIRGHNCNEQKKCTQWAHEGWQTHGLKRCGWFKSKHWQLGLLKFKWENAPESVSPFAFSLSFVESSHFVLSICFSFLMWDDRHFRYQPQIAIQVSIVYDCCARRWNSFFVLPSSSFAFSAFCCIQS